MLILEHEPKFDLDKPLEQLLRLRILGAPNFKIAQQRITMLAEQGAIVAVSNCDVLVGCERVVSNLVKAPLVAAADKKLNSWLWPPWFRTGKAIK